jgi:hypothetical protein
MIELHQRSDRTIFVAMFKAQVVAPTLAALLVNLDQEDRLGLQALEVRSPPSRRARLGHLSGHAHPFHLWLRDRPSLPSVQAHPSHLEGPEGLAPP